jgi:hypothetical protein
MFLFGFYTLLLSLSIVQGEPFLFFPQEMLPTSDTTYNFTFTGLLDTARVSGVYILQPVFDHTNQTIIGYRNYQSYVGDFQALFYGVTYLNTTYLQALIDPNTHQCINVFAETMNCTKWSNTEAHQWQSNCSLVRDGTSISGEITNLIRSSSTDSKKPSSYIGTARITGLSETTTISYEFLSQTEENLFHKSIVTFE